MKYKKNDKRGLCKCGHKKIFHVSRRGLYNMECEHQSKEMVYNNDKEKEEEHHFKDCDCKKFEGVFE